MKGTNMSRIAWIWRIWRERPALIALLFLLTLLSSAVAVTYPFLSKLLLDALQASLETGAAARGEAMDEIDRIVLLFLAVGAAGLVAGLFPGIRGLTNNVFEHLIRTKYFARVMAKDHRFFAAFRSGDVVTRLTDDLYDFPKLSWFLCSGIFRAVESISKVAFCLGAMLLIHPRLTLWSVLPLPAMIAVFWITQDRIYDTFRRNQGAISDINSEFLAQVRNTVQQPAHDRHKVWMAEQGLLQMVRTGDLNYRQALSASMGISAGVPVRSDDALRQSKTSIIVFTSLVCRAAIEGGLSPEEAYALGDSYIQSAENAKTLEDLEPLGLMMYDDFVRRVHKCRTNPHLSQQVQKCVDYIEMNLDKKIRAADIAALVGYTEYYMTHKFKEETGLSVTDYIKFAKIERAKVLLKSTNQTVQDIAAALSFSTRNYFSRIFQEVTGQTPMEYREK